MLLIRKLIKIPIGILCLFTVAFIGLTCWLSEVMEWELDSAGPMQYKPTQSWFNRNKKIGNDEEKKPVSADPRAAPFGIAENAPLQSLAATESTFTWADLELNVQIGKETRKLLDGVCGYCIPGSLTALIGASGAGKSTRESIPQLYTKRWLLTGAV